MNMQETKSVTGRIPSNGPELQRFPIAPSVVPKRALQGLHLDYSELEHRLLATAPVYVVRPKA